MAEVFSCGFLVLRREPNLSFLLMKHAQRWDLPKGHVDEGETHMQCALRELWEETGIAEDQIRIEDEFQFVHEYDVHYRRLNRTARKRLTIFLAWLESPAEIKPTEHIGFEWRPWSPPHQIQPKTIDPLLASVDEFLQRSQPS